jgi:DNA-binding cell septation regulator SpoVG
MSEPKFGFRNALKAKKEGKVKAYFSVLIPTESIGTLEIQGFKIVEGNDGPFVSLPNRQVKVATRTPVDPDGNTVAGAVHEETKYYNNLRFDSTEKYNEFRDAMNKEVMPLVMKKLGM